MYCGSRLAQSNLERANVMLIHEHYGGDVSGHVAVGIYCF